MTLKEKIGSFDNLKNGDLIISPTDKEVTEFCIGRDGERYLKGADGISLFPIFQFDPEDFYVYNGNLKNGEKDNEYF